jgi:hypothetical protein
MASKEFDLELKIAKILATQYYNGWSSKRKCDMARSEYFKKSIHNWVSAARGIITLIRRVYG